MRAFISFFSGFRWATRSENWVIIHKMPNCKWIRDPVTLQRYSIVWIIHIYFLELCRTRSYYLQVFHDSEVLPVVFNHHQYFAAFHVKLLTISKRCVTPKQCPVQPEMRYSLFIFIYLSEDLNLSYLRWNVVLL